MRLRKHPAKRFDDNKQHAAYGIYNYLVKNGIQNEIEHTEIIDAYILLAKIQGSNKESKAEKIQNEFKFFAKFVKDWVKLNTNLLNPKEI